MTGDAKEKAAAWGNTAALGTLIMPPDLKGYGDGVQRLRINAEIRKWFKKFGAAVPFLWCMYFLNAHWLEPY